MPSKPAVGPPAPTPPTGPIRHVAPEELATAHLAGRWDDRSRALLAAEFAHLKAWFARPGAGHTPPDLGAERLPPDAPRPQGEAALARNGTLMGLAISGGGIRSATFALGALQLLAREDLLHKFDYLSTVSGGGYIGSALTWWRTQGPDCGLGRTDFPFGTEDPSDVRPGRSDDDEAARPAAQRDWNPGYATPAQRERLRFLRQHGNYLTPGGGLNLVSGAAVALRGVFLSLLAWLLLLTLAMVALMRVPDVLYDTFSRADPLGIAQFWLRGHAAWLGVPWLLQLLPFPERGLPPVFELSLWLAAGLFACVLLAAVLYSFVTFFRMSQTLSYRARRYHETWLGPLYSFIACLLVLGATALVGESATDSAGLLGSGGLAAGLVSGIWTFLRNQAGQNGRLPLSVVATAGSLLLLFGALVVSYVLAGWIIGHGYRWDLAFATLTLAYTFLVNLNYASIHRLYRDRLMEAFLPDPNDVGRRALPPAVRANRTRLEHLRGPSATVGPYHLINANVVLVGSRVRTWRLRGGDNFLLSPLVCGSGATGWQATSRFAGGTLTLATAMAISGAAANPNTGTGLTRNTAVSLLMAVLGISLGYWVSHPLDRIRRYLPPNHLWPGLCSVLPRSLNERAGYLQLSDGGHFENLAVYELIRRRVRLILLCDGAADPGFAFEDFQVLIRRIEADFGAQIFFDPFNRLEMLIPTEEAAYPAQARTAQRGHIVGEISYCDGSRGVLVYLKTTVIDALSLKTKGYKGAHPDFPDETTADQFFDEDQFEAYRELGYRLAERLVREVRHAAAAGPVVGLPALMGCVEDGKLG